ncbi:hypothetical protein [Paenibacillus xylaniclasticus]|uniref:hypothetical protein n=1 Tax=Paenibacillus xylaniclasticus TaxID=588083 RepID=UPI0013DFB271|nr:MULTISPECIES: hypothetical protein [Paenibacillus]GFN31490.1 hypothetical protein PCURB6_17500 [Paenibacillus curdlanolyticus]
MAKKQSQQTSKAAVQSTELNKLSEFDTEFAAEPAAEAAKAFQNHRKQPTQQEYQ